jgi:hypothetical protein
MGREVGQRSSEQHQPGVPLALVRHRRLSVTRRHREDVETMPVTSTQSVVAKMHLRDGAIYRDSSNNIIRLLSIHGDYCAYVYIALGDPRWEMHGSVTGVTRRNVFEADFVFVSECVEDWNGSQRCPNLKKGAPDGVTRFPKGHLTARPVVADGPFFITDEPSCRPPASSTLFER